MPLQIRRGTQAERDQLVVANVPLAEGEPLWETTNKKLYVGDGVTAGGVLLETAVDLSDYEGIIGADGFAGPVYAVDSTVLVDYTNGSINLSGTVKGDIIPDADQAYDLGSVSRRFKDLWLSGNSLWLGDAQITASGTTVDLPAGSTINGNPVGGGVVDGNNYRINILGSDSSVIVDSTTGTLNGDLFGDVVGNVTGDVVGNVTGDVVGSILSDDSLVLINGSNGNIFNGDISITQNTISALSSLIVFKENNSLSLKMDSEDNANFIKMQGISGSNFLDTATVIFDFSQGTLAEPGTNIEGDYIGGFKFNSFNGVDFQASATIFALTDGNPINDQIPGKIELQTIDSLGTGVNLAYFDSKGTFYSPVMKTGVYITSPEDTRPGSPETGMIIFNETLGIFEGWNGVEWAALSSPPP